MSKGDAVPTLVGRLQKYVGLEKSGCDGLLSVYTNCCTDSNVPVPPPIQLSSAGLATLLLDASLASGGAESAATVMCTELAATIGRVIAPDDTDTITINSFAVALLILTTETWTDRASRTLCALVAIEQAVAPTTEDISLYELIDWLERYDIYYSQLLSTAITEMPLSAACEALELDPREETAPLEDTATWLAENGLGVDDEERRERAERLFRGVNCMLGQAPSDTLAHSINFYDLRLFGGTPDGWEAIGRMLRPTAICPQLILTQLTLLRDRAWCIAPNGHQPLLCSFKARAAHYRAPVGMRILKNRLYSSLPDSKVLLLPPARSEWCWAGSIQTDHA